MKTQKNELIKQYQKKYKMNKKISRCEVRRMLTKAKWGHLRSQNIFFIIHSILHYASLIWKPVECNIFENEFSEPSPNPAWLLC